MANPFGIEAGLTPPSGMASYHVILHSVPKPHPDFKHYSGVWKPEFGLVKILGTSERFLEDSTASNARRLYEKVKRQLTQIYGTPSEHEFVTSDVWEEDKDFCFTLENGDRVHASIWEMGSHNLQDDIQKIFLMVNSDDGYETSTVSLSYDFPGLEQEAVGDEYGIDSL